MRRAPGLLKLNRRCKLLQLSIIIDADLCEDTDCVHEFSATISNDLKELDRIRF